MVLEEIKNNEELRNISVIVLTADNSAEVESLRRGAIDFLNKPYDRPEVIRARVRRAIELSIDRNIIDAIGKDKLTGLLTKDYKYRARKPLPMKSVVG